MYIIFDLECWGCEINVVVNNWVLKLDIVECYLIIKHVKTSRNVPKKNQDSALDSVIQYLTVPLLCRSWKLVAIPLLASFSYVYSISGKNEKMRAMDIHLPAILG